MKFARRFWSPANMLRSTCRWSTSDLSNPGRSCGGAGAYTISSSYRFMHRVVSTHTMMMHDPDEARRYAEFEESLRRLHPPPEPRREPIVTVLRFDGPLGSTFASNPRSFFQPPTPPTPPDPVPLSRPHTRAKGTEGQCSVCLVHMLESETLTPLTKCTHVFHSACVDKWLDMNHTCPTCRSVEDPSQHTE